MQLLRLSLERTGKYRLRECTNWGNFVVVGEIWKNSNYNDCEIDVTIAKNI